MVFFLTSNMVLGKSDGDVLFISPASNHKTNPGTLKLPSSFVAKYYKNIPESLGLRLGNGQLWFGRFVHANETIEGLEYFMRYFNIKPYHFFVFRYNGGEEFGVQIFNEYAIEIDYAPPLRIVTSSNYEASHLALSKKGLFEMTDIEKDKLRSTFTYNAYNTFHGDSEILITNELVEKKEEYLVLTEEDWVDLKLKQTMNWIELSFQNFSWKISLKWEDGEVLLGPEWYKFSTEAKLVPGDLCMLSVTNDDQKFSVAVFEFHEPNAECDTGGSFKRNGHLKWFKIMNGESVASGQLAIPLLFLEKFGDSLHDVLTLFVADGMKFEAYFSKTLNLMFGLNPLIAKYGVKENYVLFFEYVGDDTFCVSIYNLEFIEIRNELVDERMIVDTARAKRDAEVIELIDSTDDEDVVVELDESLKSFNVVLMKSHVDQNGHGVFVGRHLLPVYRKWKKGTVVQLYVGSRSWTVALLRNKKVCRFGLGWNAFTEQNKLKVGDKLIFSYVGNNIFSVEVLST